MHAENRDPGAGNTGKAAGKRRNPAEDDEYFKYLDMKGEPSRKAARQAKIWI